MSTTENERYQRFVAKRVFAQRDVSPLADSCPA
jgi:hypothetical protein